MKTKRFFLFLLFAAGLLMTGCTGKVVVSGAQVIKLDYDVRANQWVLLDDCFRATLDVPDITSSVLANGKVDVSRCYPGDNDGPDVWTPLPCIRTAVDVENGGGIFTTCIDYEWTKKTVNIFVTTSDLFTDYNPGDMSFRVYITK